MLLTMEIDIKNGNREFIDAKKVNKHVQDFLSWLESWLENTETKLNDKYIPLAKEWMKIGKDAILTPCVEEELELLTKDDFVSIIRKHKVVGCDSNIAYKKMNRDGSFQIVVSYLKDGEFLPANQNVNIFINCEGLSKDMKDMFNDRELIVVK